LRDIVPYDLLKMLIVLAE